MEKVYKTITVGEKTVLDGSGVEMDIFIEESHPCLYCGKPVYSKRKYCNDSCKAAYHRLKKERERKDKIKAEIERFKLFIQENPEIYLAIKGKAVALLNSGAERISIKYIVEAVRKDFRIHIDNDFTPLFARKLACWNPDIKKRLVIRKSRFDKYLGIGDAKNM